VEEAGTLARRGLHARAKFLRRAAAGPDGPLAAFAAAEGRRVPLLDMDAATHSLGVTGLNEAVLLVSGEELHESDEALKLGLRALGALETAGGAAGEDDVSADLDAEEDPGVASRFFARDEQEHPAAAERLRKTYTPGVALRDDAPVDLAMRTETEGRIAMAVRTSTVRWTLSDAGPVAPETLLALLGKTWRNTRLRQVLLVRGR
jgi:ribonucleoside-triphosphate reductase